MIPHKTASAFFLTVLAPLAVAVTSSPASQEAFADAITRLPANMFYEESDDAFHQRLMAGRFWLRDAFFYLAITGDGSFGKRLFIWDGKQTITVIHFCAADDGGRSYQIYQCNCRQGTCTFLGEFEPALFEGSSLSQ